MKPHAKALPHFKLFHDLLSFLSLYSGSEGQKPQDSLMFHGEKSVEDFDLKVVKIYLLKGKGCITK